MDLPVIATSSGQTSHDIGTVVSIVKSEGSADEKIDVESLKVEEEEPSIEVGKSQDEQKSHIESDVCF